MKRIIILANDPGGYDAINSIYQYMKNDNVDFLCVGPAGNINIENKSTELMAMEYIHKQIEASNLRLLITGTSWGSDFELIAINECKKYEILTISILDYWSNYKSRFICKNGNVVFPDYYILMDELAKKEAITEGVPENIIKVLGHPGIDKWINSKPCRIESSDTIKVLFLSQPLSKLYGDSLGYNESEVLKEFIDVIGLFKNFTPHIKFHPKDDKVLKEKYNEYRIEKDLDMILSTYDLVIGMNSIALLFSVLSGKPTISFQPNLKGRDLCITNKLGLTKLMLSAEELKLFMQKYIKGKKMDISEKLEKYIWSDGKSTERVSSFIEKIGEV